MLVLLAVGTATALAAAAGFLVSELTTFRAGLQRHLREQARVVGLNSVAALAFDDTNVAQQVLSTLSNDTRIVAAALFRTDGTVFARFDGTNAVASAALPVPPEVGAEAEAEGTRSEGGRIHLYSRIEDDSGWIGTAYVQSDQRELRDRLWRHGQIAGGVLTVSLLLAVGLAVVFQRLVSQPILELAATADAVAAGKDYGIRARSRRRDELGHLADRFNEMLAQVQARDAELRQARDELERRVGERTAELSRANDSLLQQAAERERARLALNASEALYRSTVDSLDAALHVVGPDLTLVFGNAQLTRWRAALGLPDVKLIGRHVSAAFPFSPVALEREYAEVLSTRRPLATREVVDLAGRTVCTETRKIPIVEGGTVQRIITIIRDTTESRQIEEQLRQSQKMEAVGQLAGGVAHDFNNILTIIHGHVGLLLVDAPSPGPVRDSLCQIRAAAERAAGLTRQLLTFSRRQVANPSLVDLGEVAGNAVRMLERLIGETIALQLGELPVLPAVRADPVMVEQVLMNLAVNARDAMPDGGRLRIELHPVVFAAPEIAAHVERRPGRFVCLSVADTGMGIDPAHLPRVFEPFFTTKATGKGTGLGLATVYGIVRQHEGWIEVESRVGAGTTFRVFLPAVDGARAEPPNGAATASAAERGGAGEEILVVEDEAALRALMCAVLRGAGYRTWAAGDGREALAVWEQHRQGCRVLLTDMVMPGGLSGRDLARQLRQDRPGLEVIITSGYSLELAEHRRVPTNEYRFLPKPFQPADLLRTVRACLPEAKA